MSERIELDAAGEIDEIVTHGGGHLERLSDKGWYLSLTRADGSSVSIIFTGKVNSWEVCPPQKCGTCAATILDTSPTDNGYLLCSKCGWSGRDHRRTEG